MGSNCTTRIDSIFDGFCILTQHRWLREYVWRIWQFEVISSNADSNKYAAVDADADADDMAKFVESTPKS